MARAVCRKRDDGEFEVVIVDLPEGVVLPEIRGVSAAEALDEFRRVIKGREKELGLWRKG